MKIYFDYYGGDRDSVPAIEFYAIPSEVISSSRAWEEAEAYARQQVPTARDGGGWFIDSYRDLETFIRFEASRWMDRETAARAIEAATAFDAAQRRYVADNYQPAAEVAEFIETGIGLGNPRPAEYSEIDTREGYGVSTDSCSWYVVRKI